MFDNKYGPRTRKGRELGNNQVGDGARFRGRGLVQITGRSNYTDWTRRLQNDGVEANGAPADLVGHPEQAADPTIAARIAAEGMQKGTFTRRKLGDYVNDTKSDYVGARYVINGQDHAPEIAARARSFEGIIKNNPNEFYGAMMASQMKHLPSAHEDVPLTGGAGLADPTVFANGPMSGTPSKFESIDKFAKRPIGQFTPTPAAKK